MPIKHGQYIDAQTVEFETSRWDGARFETFCNAYVWSIAPHAQLTSVSNARDGGVDAEVIMGEDWDETTNPVLRRGRNVFQYKKRTKPLSPCEVKGEFNRLNSYSPLSKYILITNFRLTQVKILKLKESIADGLKPAPLERIQIICAGELEGFLYNNPHIRSAFFNENFFQTWQSNYDLFIKKNSKVSTSLVDLVGREQELDTLKQFVADKNVRCIVVSGPAMIGKTRLVLDGLKPIQNQVIFSLSPNALSMKELEGLTNPKEEVVCVVEDPDLQKVREINLLAFQITNLKIVITLPTRDRSIHANYGFDPRTQILEIKPLTWEQSRHLLHLSRQFIPENKEEWILRQAEGVPGLLLMAISLLDKPRECPFNLIQQIGEEVKNRIQKQFGEESIEVLKRLSLLTHVGVSGEYADEIKGICQEFQDVDVNKVLNYSKKLIYTGLIQQKGDFLEVSIPLLANHLANELLLGNMDKLLRLIAALKPSTCFRLFARLSSIQNDVTQKLWDALFATYFNDFTRVTTHAEILVYLAGTVPEKVLRCLEAFLLESDYDFRLSIKDNKRRSLMRILEQLLYRKKTSYGALRLIGLLAEVENETYGNNSASIFVVCFHYVPYSLPLSFEKRLILLNEFVSRNREKLISLAITAIANSFNRFQSWSPSSSKGFSPFDDVFKPLVWGEIFKYAEQLLIQLWDIVNSNNLCSKEAISLLPKLLVDISGIAPILSELSVEYFEKIVSYAISNKMIVNFNSLQKHLQQTIKIFEKLRDKNNNNDPYLTYIRKLEKQIEIIYGSSFEICLKRLIEGWNSLLERDSDDMEFSELANMVISNNSLLTDSVWEFLLSQEAKRNYQFFFVLGQQDKDLTLWDILLKKLNNNDLGYLFCNYFRGFVGLDHGMANKVWEERIDKSDIAPVIWINTLMRLTPTENRIEKIIYRLNSNLIDPNITASALYISHFFDHLTAQQFFLILQSIVGKNYENSLSILQLLDRWILMEKILIADLVSLGWNCLQNLPSIKDNIEQYDIDRIAAYLTKNDPKKGFEIFQYALQRYMESEDAYRQGVNSDTVWNPFDPFESTEFADALREIDTERFYRIFFELTEKQNIKYLGSEYLMKAYLDLDRDYDVILKLAKESKENAIIISNWVTSESNCFYDFVNEILPTYPNDEDIKFNLVKGIEQTTLTHVGPYHEFLNSLLPDIDKRIEDKNTHIVVREWLKDIKEGLLQQIGRHIVWDYHEDIVSLRRHIDDKNSEMRLWAIGRILEKGNPKDILEMLSVEEIAEALPRIQLPESKRELLEKLLQVWQNAV